MILTAKAYYTKKKEEKKTFAPIQRIINILNYGYDNQNVFLRYYLVIKDIIICVC